jgi:hypothetical protein
MTVVHEVHAKASATHPGRFDDIAQLELRIPKDQLDCNFAAKTVL